MASPLKDKIIHFPHKPGCYLFKDTAGVVLYVGKAKDLRKRVSQYFGQDKRPQLPFLIEDACDIDYIVARTELEALFLENTLIKKHSPKYNIKLKDDKNYAFIVIDYATQIPQIGYARKIEANQQLLTFLNPSASWGTGKKPKTLSAPTQRRGISPTGGETLPPLGEGGRRPDEGLAKDQGLRIKDANYFGPYSSAKKIRETLDFARRIFPYCANTEVSDRPCFYYHLHRCPGICIGLVSLDEYQQHLSRIKLFLNGKTAEVKKEIKVSMQEASKHKRFELAARLRDQLKALEVLEERQIAQFPSKVNYDLISLGMQSGLYCINLFKVRDGKLTDKENFVYSDPNMRTGSNNDTNVFSGPSPHEGRLGGVVDIFENDPQVTTTSPSPSSIPTRAGRDYDQGVGGGGQDPESNITQAFTETYYTDTTDLPDKIFTQHPLPELSLISALLEQRKGKKVSLAIPHRGKLLQLIKLGQLNAEEYLRKQLETDASDIDKLQEALQKLQKLLKLPSLPRRIECYDMSNTQGTNPVGSMVVFVDGKPAKSEYRKFKIRSKNTPDDFAMMRETLARRLARLEVTSNEYKVTSKDIKTDSSLVTRHSSPATWPRPDLIVIDGGKGQLSAAQEAQEGVISAKLQVQSGDQDIHSALSTHNSTLLPIPMIGLAKRIEEIFLPNDPEPIILSHNDPALQMLQRLRDEAHRFCLTFHRQLRSKQATKSALDTLPGIGPKTKKLLKQKFGTVANVKKVALEKIEELEELVGKQKAEIIKKNL